MVGRRGGEGRCGRQNRVALASVADAKSAVSAIAQPGRIAVQFAGDGGKMSSSPGRARHKPLKPLRRKRRVFRGNLRRRQCAFFRTRAAGAEGTRRFRALHGGSFNQSSGARCCEIANSRLWAVCRNVCFTHCATRWLAAEAWSTCTSRGPRFAICVAKFPGSRYPGR